MKYLSSLNFKYEFNIRYYYNKMVSIPYIEKCLYCDNGNHTRFVDNQIVICPVCNGSGKKNSGHGSIKEEPRICFLNTIKTETDIDNTEIIYIFVDEYNNVLTDVSNPYETIDECINAQIKDCYMGY